MNADHLIFYFYLTVFKLPLARLPLFLLAIITVIWIRHFHKQKHSNPSRPGLTGLYDRPKGHPQKRLKAQHEKQIKKRLDQSKGPHGTSFIKLFYTQTSAVTKEKTDLDYTIELVTTSCNFGGVRYWFICPLVVNSWPCGRRVTRFLVPFFALAFREFILIPP